MAAAAPGPEFKIVVVGGGTAGWMAASLMRERWPAVEIVVLEAPDIGIIGVGEGSTPQLKAFFSGLGVDEAEWMKKCNATYKNGISFHGWSEAPGASSYFHPFPSPIDAHTTPAFHYNNFARRRGIDLVTQSDRFFLSAKLAEKKLAPTPTRNFPFSIAYGYHFDAFLVGAFLRDRAKGKNVQHVEGKVAGVNLGADGDITSLTLDDGGEISASLYVDATGFRSLLLQDALGVSFRPFKENLFNDSAVVMPTTADAEGLSSETRSIAMKAGWRWEIPLTNRSGNGYVYSSDFMSADEAEAELRSALGLSKSHVAARHLKMKVGRVEQHWAKNCLGVGLSQGFIEPLEATALHLVQTTVERFMDHFTEGGLSPAKRDDFNAEINARFEGVRDYIVSHYRMNKRTDTEYWRACAANDHMSDSLRSIFECWFSGGDMREEIRRQDIGKYYADVSWQCLLGGYGQFPKKLRAPEPQDARFDIAVIDDFVDRCALNFPEHRQALAST